MRRRFGWWLLVACLAAGCAAPAAPEPAVSDQADVWFMQHMVPHLRETLVVASLTRERLRDPGLARLADRIARRGQADVDQLQRWLDQRGLSAHGHSHQPADGRHQTDLERLGRLRGHALDRAFAQVMTARARTAGRLAAAEAGAGGLPEVRRFALRLAADLRRLSRELRSWEQDTTRRRTQMDAATAAAAGRRWAGR